VRRDPYRVLGVSPGASAEELHDAYRALVKLHHPDRNGGSAESTRRFQEIQQAYDELRARPRPSRPPKTADPRGDSVADRMAKLERELREANAARERARRAARDAVRDAGAQAQAPAAAEEDSFGKILGDIRDELSDRVSGARRHPAVKRVNDLIDGLDDLASRLDRR
jgi:curved DNA-binding protein CbpA